jgi:5-methylcytosine-specific restriction enzyme subunit McrC
MITVPRIFPVHEMAEWKTHVIPGVGLSEVDRRLADDLAQGEGGRLIVEELRSGVRVIAKSWVGVVRFESFEIRVVPKLAGGNFGIVRMIEFATGLGALRRNIGARKLDIQGANLFDLVALLLAEHCEYLVRGGLLSDYVEIEDEVTVVRGRILADKQILKKFGRIDRLICRFDEHEQNIAENQILGAALDKCARRVQDETVRLRVGRLRSFFEEVCSYQKLDFESTQQRMVYHRLNSHYRDPHKLAWLILEGLGALNDLFTTGQTTCFAFLIDMNLLFERFVYRLFEKILASTSLEVEYQRADRSIIWNADKNLPYSSVRPDLLIRSRHLLLRRLAIDAKYKLYDERKISPADVYQSFLYAYAYSDKLGEKELPAALILYPSSISLRQSIRLHIRTARRLVGAEVSALGLSISDCLNEIEGSSPGPTLATLMQSVTNTMGVISES